MVDVYGSVAQPLLDRFEREFLLKPGLEGTVQDITRHMARVAKAIETQARGQMYWLLFERLERELAMRLDRSARLADARAAVRQDEADP